MKLNREVTLYLLALIFAVVGGVGLLLKIDVLAGLGGLVAIVSALLAQSPVKPKDPPADKPAGGGGSSSSDYTRTAGVLVVALAGAALALAVASAGCGPVHLAAQTPAVAEALCDGAVGMSADACELAAGESDDPAEVERLRTAAGLLRDVGPVACDALRSYLEAAAARAAEEAARPAPAP